MAADFTQDSVLWFLQSRGGSAKNSDLLLHFRAFLQDPADRDRNRELFKKYVNSVAIVKQVDGASHVVLRKNFRGHVSGAGRDSSRAGNYTEPVAVNTERAGSRAPPGEGERNAALAAAGIVGKNHNNVETQTNKQLPEQQEVNTRNTSPEPLIRRSQQQVNISADPLIRRVQVGGQQQVLISSEPVIRPVQAGGQQLVNIRNTSPEPLIRRVQVGGQQEVHISSEPSIRPVQVGGQQLVNISSEPSIRPVQVGGQQQVNISSEPLIRPVQVGGQQQVNISSEPLIRPVQVGGQQQVNISSEPLIRPVQVGGQQQVNISSEPLIRPVQAGGQQLVNIRNTSPEPLIRRVQVGGQQEVHISSNPLIRPVQVGGQQLVNISPEPLIRRVQVGGQQEVHISSNPLIRPVQVGGQQLVNISSNPVIRQVQVGGLSEFSGPDQNTKLGQQRLVYVPSPGPPALRLQEPDPHRGLHQVPARRFRHRPSYKSAVSQDDDDVEEEEEEEAPMRPGSGGVWPLNAPLRDSGRTISALLPCLTESPEPPPSSSGRTVPQIYIQHTEEIPDPLDLLEVRPRLEASSVSMETAPIGQSLPLESEHYSKVPESAGAPLVSRQEPQRQSSPRPSPKDRISSTDWPPSGSSTTSEWTSSSEGLWARADQPAALNTIQEVLQGPERPALEPAAYRVVPWHRSTGNLYDEEPSKGCLSPLRRSTDCLHVDQRFTSRAVPWHLSTGDLYDDREEAESSEGSISSPQVQMRSAVARRLSSRARNRMCRSLGTDLDQILQEEGGMVAVNEAARLDRLHRISSSLSLPFNRSTSSLSSCTTPPRCPSPANHMEAEERRLGRRSLTSTMSAHSQQSPVPLEPREHAWMVNAAMGAWTEIFSLFREDSSLLNKRDFISGFTVLHWIAKHGAHRALNTLWYGVEKFGLTFDINAKATGGQTPLHIAAIYGHKKVIQLLVRKFHADVKLRDTAGKRPWQYLSDKSPDVLQMLGAPARAALTDSVGKEDADWQPKSQRRRLHHRFSSAASTQRPLTLSQLTKVKRSTSIAALLKHKSIPRF